MKVSKNFDPMALVSMVFHKTKTPGFVMVSFQEMSEDGMNERNIMLTEIKDVMKKIIEEVLVLRYMRLFLLQKNGLTF